MDLVAELQTGERIIIEVQSERQSYYRKRAVYYAGIAYTGSLDKNENYSALKKVISIHILNFKLFEDARAYRKFELIDIEGWEKHHPQGRKIHKEDYLIDLLALHFLELPKKILQNMNNRLQLWFQFMKNPTKALALFDKEALKQDPCFQRAYEELEKLSSDPEMRAVYEAELKAIRDTASNMESSFEEGVNQATKKAEAEKKSLKKQVEAANKTAEAEKKKAEAEKNALRKQADEKKNEIASNFLKQGIDMAIIASCTGLTLKEIKVLQHLK